MAESAQGITLPARATLREWQRKIAELMAFYGPTAYFSAGANPDETIYGRIPENTAVPTVSGTQTSGNVVTASTGTWRNAGTATFAYQWKNAGVDLVGNGATTNAYTLQATDVGDAINCIVTCTNQYGSETATTAGFTPAS